MRPRIVAVLACCFLATTAFAQEQNLRETDSQETKVGVLEARPAAANAFQEERTILEDLLMSLVGLVKEVATDASTSGITSRLSEMTGRLTSITDVQSGYTFSKDTGESSESMVPLRSPDELDQLEHLLRDIVDQLVDIRHELHVDGKSELAEKTKSMEEQLLDGLTLVRTLQAAESEDSRLRGDIRDQSERSVPMRTTERRVSKDGYLLPGEYSGRSDWNQEPETDNRGQQNADGSPDYGNTDYDTTDSDNTDYDNADYDNAAGANTDDGDIENGKVIWTERTTEWDRSDDEEWDKPERRTHWRNRGLVDGSRSAFATYVGEFRYGWPFKETGVYRTAPAVRYNRVDGLVLGLRKLPLAWDSWDRATIYGHGGYAIASRRWQYEIGAETRLGGRDAKDLDAKIGGSYRRATTTDDLWKSSWLENSIGALLFNYDFFDYYETEGFTGYATVRVTPYAQVTGAYRSEDYSSLSRETTWSLFGGDNFTPNPFIEDGRMNSVLVVVEGGSVRDYDWIPRGGAFRIEGEIGKGLGGDFDFNRVVADGRVYVPLGGPGTLALRVRGGLASGDLPFQKLFRIGGVGSVRSYSQNSQMGSRTLVGNAEYLFTQDFIVDDLTFSVFADAGWTNRFSNEFSFDDVFPTAGLGLGLIDQSVRLELAFPLDTERAGTKSPSLWIRLARGF